MRHVLLTLLMLTFAVHPALAQSDTRPAAAKTYAAQGVTIELFADDIPQGRAGVVRVSAPGISEGRVEIFNETRALFAIPGEDDALYGVIATTLEQPIRTYDMTVRVTVNGERRALLVPIDVSNGGFIRQEVTLGPDQAELIDREIEDDEYTLLDTLTVPTTAARYWDDEGFAFPADGELTSPFGAVRAFNGDYETRHTGWDFNGGQGDLMRAMAGGRVVYAGNMDIRGGYVLLDHGHGVYSGYAHLSVIHVIEGQFVRQGQLVGLAGSTGRSSDPHLHVEMRLNDRWIDPVDFVNMWLP